MQVDIKDILDGKKKGISIAYSFTPEECSDFTQEMVLLEDCKIEGRIHYIDEQLAIDADLRARVELPCSLCLSHVETSLDKHIVVGLTEESLEYYDDMDSYTIGNSMVDIKRICLLQIMEEIPFKVLCREDCKGLCPVCGNDLNIEECDCTTTQGSGFTDNELEKLKELLGQRR